MAGTNKQQHLREAPEAGVQYVPLIQVGGQSTNQPNTGW